jgi:hypothetical protein
MRNAARRLSGRYGCVVEFFGSGAKLETPNELIIVAGEYHGPWTILLLNMQNVNSSFGRCIGRQNSLKKTSSHDKQRQKKLDDRLPEDGTLAN